MPLEQAVEAAFDIQEQFAPRQEIGTVAASPAPSSAKTPKANSFGLTSREIEVLQQVSLGLTDSQIAAKLVISPRTVEAHVRSILNKLGVNSRTSATRSAFAHNLVSIGNDQESVK
jgi:DNA-binding NarL/FixJ family response regulator